MIAINNERRKQLSKENRAYYEDMLVYLRTSRIPTKKSEELLLEMLDHLLTAQEEGKTAEDVFGTEPKAYCEEIVETFGRRPISFKRYMLMFSIGLYVAFFVHAITEGVVLRLLNVLFDLPLTREGYSLHLFILPFLGVFVVEAVFFFMRKSTFETLSKKVLRGYLPSMLIIYVLPLVGFLAILLYFGEALPALPLEPWMSLLVGVGLYIVHKLVFRNVEID